MAGRVPTFCFDVPRLGPREVAERLARRDVAVWWGNYYAAETMKWLGLDPDEGAVRAGIVHYNTDEEVDRLLAALAELKREAPGARRHEVPGAGGRGRGGRPK